MLDDVIMYSLLYGGVEFGIIKPKRRLVLDVGVDDWRADKNLRVLSSVLFDVYFNERRFVAAL